MDLHKLIDTASALVANDKGLLAMDESNPTCNKRFAKLGIAETEERRRAYREMIITTPGLGECISGTIRSAALVFTTGNRLLLIGWLLSALTSVTPWVERLHCSVFVRRNFHVSRCDQG